MITITDRAKKHFADLYNSNSEQFIKLKVTTKGCSGHSYDLSFCSEKDITPLDDKIELENSFTLVLDQKSIMWLMGTQIDWIEDRFGSKFDFANPMIAGTCGCGESFHFENEKYPGLILPK